MGVRIIGIVLLCIGVIGMMTSRRRVDHIVRREKERGTDPGIPRSNMLLYFRGHFALIAILGLFLTIVGPK